MGLRCPSCGEDNRDGAPFCMMCKEVLKRVPSSSSRPPPAPNGAAPPPPVTSRFDHARMAQAMTALDPMSAGFGMTLDFSLASVMSLDVFQDEMWGPDGDAPGRPDWKPGAARMSAIERLSAYLGEVVRRTTSGTTWQDDPARPDDPHRSVVVVNGRRFSPFERVLQRAREGARHDFYSWVVAIRPLAPGDAASFVSQAQNLLARSQIPVETRNALALRLFRQALALDPKLAPGLAPTVARLEAEKRDVEARVLGP